MLINNQPFTFGRTGRPDLGQIYNQEPLADVTFICANGTEKVHAHSVVLIQASPFLKDLLSGCSCCCDKTIFLPEWRAGHVHQLLSLMYFGKVELHRQFELHELSVLGSQLGVDIRRWELAPFCHEVAARPGPKASGSSCSRDKRRGGDQRTKQGANGRANLNESVDSYPFDIDLESLFDDPPPTPELVLPPDENEQVNDENVKYEGNDQLPSNNSGNSGTNLKEPKEEGESDQSDDECMIIGEAPSEASWTDVGEEVSVRRHGGVKIVTRYRILKMKKPKKNSIPPTNLDQDFDSKSPLHLVPPPSASAQSITSDYATLSTCSPKSMESFSGNDANPSNSSMSNHGYGSLTGTPQLNSFDDDGDVDAEIDDLPPVLRHFQAEEKRLKRRLEDDGVFSEEDGASSKPSKTDTRGHQLVESCLASEEPCEMCSRKGLRLLTSLVCRRCDVPLHRTCFEVYHVEVLNFPAI